MCTHNHNHNNGGTNFYNYFYNAARYNDNHVFNNYLHYFYNGSPNYDDDPNDDDFAVWNDVSRNIR